MATEDKNKAKKETTGGNNYTFNDNSVMHSEGSNFGNADNDVNHHDNTTNVNINGYKLSPEELEQFADWLRTERKEKKMTQKDVADKTGIDLKYYQKLESRKLPIEPRLATVNRLAKFFGYEGINLSAKKKTGFESSILKPT